jgi:hypothetical protein
MGVLSDYLPVEQNLEVSQISKIFGLVGAVTQANLVADD